jgi:glycosyltransferase involved in cell wall biosynthesis
VRICIIGKFPPIQGGVAVRTYWVAHDLAARGHEVHVVTNAKEAAPPFRLHMRRRDWKRCEAAYEGGGSVKLHWTDPLDRSQHFIPLASPFVSKLAATAAKVNAERPFDVIYSHYLEPYGVAAHLAAEIARVPHVARMAGSDAGRLWRHPQLEVLYDHVLRSAAAVIASGSVAGRAIKHGVDPKRIVPGESFALPEDLFCPEGPKVGLAALRREVELESPELLDAFWGEFSGELPFFGIYGKLGETKGSYALLDALARLKAEKLDVALVAMSHGWPRLEQKFRAHAEELGLADRVLQIPFLPHWRVPEFLRSCLAVCCLEQDFPIIFHTPIIAREVLTCGKCLVGSTEVIRKIPDYLRLPDGYGCVAIPDVWDIDALASRLGAMICDPEPIADVAARARAFAAALQAEAKADCTIEGILVGAARSNGRRKLRATKAASVEIPSPAGAEDIDLMQAREMLKVAEAAVAAGEDELQPAAAAIRLRIAIAEAELPLARQADGPGSDPLFRLRASRWGLGEGELARLYPLRDPSLRIISFDAAELRTKRRRAGISAPRNLAAFAHADGEERREPLLLSGVAVRTLGLSDGTSSAQEVADRLAAENLRLSTTEALRLIENLFVAGLLWLCDPSRSAVPRVIAEPELASSHLADHQGGL